MRVLLQHKKTGLFFVSEDFRSALSAMLAAWRHKLNDATVVLAFGEDSTDVRFLVWDEGLAAGI